jgi:hypothetical protein
MRAGVGSLQDRQVIEGRTYARACSSIACRLAGNWPVPPAPNGRVHLRRRAPSLQAGLPGAHEAQRMLPRRAETQFGSPSPASCMPGCGVQSGVSCASAAGVPTTPCNRSRLGTRINGCACLSTPQVALSLAAAGPHVTRAPWHLRRASTQQMGMALLPRLKHGQSLAS